MISKQQYALLAEQKLKAVTGLCDGVIKQTGIRNESQITRIRRFIVDKRSAPVKRASRRQGLGQKVMDVLPGEIDSEQPGCAS